jgi:hypothetical protein
MYLLLVVSVLALSQEARSVDINCQTIVGYYDGAFTYTHGVHVFDAQFEVRFSVNETEQRIYGSFDEVNQTYMATNDYIMLHLLSDIDAPL